MHAEPREPAERRQEVDPGRLLLVREDRGREGSSCSALGGFHQKIQTDAVLARRAGRPRIRSLAFSAIMMVGALV